MNSKFVHEVLTIGREILEICQQCKAIEKVLPIIESYKKGSTYPEVSFIFKFGAFDSQTFKTNMPKDSAVLKATQEFLEEIARLNRNEIRHLLDTLAKVSKVDEE